VFSCEVKRISVFSEARFCWRAKETANTRNFAKPPLDLLESPWPRATTSDLLAEILIMADLGGNGFIYADADQLRVMRPDWVTIVMGDSSGRPVQSPAQLDAEILGYIYDPADGRTDAEVLLVDEVAHFIPPGMRDPMTRFRGMSWLTPVIREVQADQAATMHKLAFFENGATPQLVVTLDASIGQPAFEKFVRRMDETHMGWRNAYKTLYLGSGADVTVVGKDLSQLDFSNTQGKGETRIGAASGIHPVLVPLSEGMQGSSLNAGNYGAARRSTADMTFRPLWRNICGTLATILPSARDAELWYEEGDIPFLREDAADAAQIMATQSATVANLVKEGFTAASAIRAVKALDVDLLEHTGLVSVQLQAPGATLPTSSSPPALPAPSNGQSAPADMAMG